MNSIDFLDELAELALGSRLKRLSDRLMTDASNIYKACGHNVQPKWFALLALLHSKKSVSVVEASEQLGLTQPAISQFVKELLAQGLINSRPSLKDSRRKVITLSHYGEQSVLKMQPMWQAVRSAAKEICEEAGAGFFESVKRLEKSLSQSNLEKLKMDSETINPEVEIIEFKPELASYFKQINTEWITDMFKMEKSDHEILNKPEKLVVDNGGKIYFARLPKLGIVGTCALLKKDNNSFELTKMGVFEKARGKKIGETLLNHVIQQTEEMNVKNLFLLTNSICEAAIHLYLKFGFKHDSETMQRYASKYDRCDVAMRYYGKEKDPI